MTASDYIDGLAECMTERVLATFKRETASVDDAMDVLVEEVMNANAVALIGNGGSAAVVAHAHNDLMKAGHVRSLVFQDVPLLTAYTNDCGYEYSYEQPLAKWLGVVDLLIVLSSSGKSPNILAAAETARKHDCKVVTFSGFKPDNQLRAMGDINFYVPSMNFGQVELTHAALLHYMTDMVAVDA